MRRTYTMVILFSIIFLGPSMYGFVTKFREFIHVFHDAPEGIFSITPMVNYLLASLGFFCLLLWSTCNGMFRDIEQPKYSMLQREWDLDHPGDQPQ